MKCCLEQRQHILLLQGPHHAEGLELCSHTELSVTLGRWKLPEFRGSRLSLAWGLRPATQLWPRQHSDVDVPFARAQEAGLSQEQVVRLLFQG